MKKTSSILALFTVLFIAGAGSIVYDPILDGLRKYDINDVWRSNQLILNNLVVGYYNQSVQSMQFYSGNDTNGTYNEPDGTVVFKGAATVWDDMRIIPSGMDRQGTTADPTLVQMKAGVFAWEFAKNDEAYFTVQIPHSYKVGSSMYVHVHWSPGGQGNEEVDHAVGWKVDYNIAAINGAIGNMSTADLSDTVTGTDYIHEMTADVTVSGSGAGVSSIIIGKIYRTDTGADDTWAGTASGSLPLLLELDFHYEMDTVGSREHAGK